MKIKLEDCQVINDRVYNIIESKSPEEFRINISSEAYIEYKNNALVFKSVRISRKYPLNKWKIIWQLLWGKIS
jgi:CRISPR/Cas system-associated endonuclease Cas1